MLSLSLSHLHWITFSLWHKFPFMESPLCNHFFPAALLPILLDHFDSHLLFCIHLHCPSTGDGDGVVCVCFVHNIRASGVGKDVGGCAAWKVMSIWMDLIAIGILVLMAASDWVASFEPGAKMGNDGGCVPPNNTSDVITRFRLVREKICTSPFHPLTPKPTNQPTRTSRI